MRPIAGLNDLQTLEPELSALWSEKNPKGPSEFFPSSGVSAIWNNSICGHSYPMVIRGRVAQSIEFCPFCSNLRLLPGFNDLATAAPGLMKYWHSTKNGELSPNRVLAVSNKKVWWLCGKGHESFIEPMRRRSHSCRDCVAGFSKIEREFGDWLEAEIKGLKLLRNHRKLIYPLEVDLYIEELKLAVEFNGDYFHSNRHILERKGVSATAYHKNKLELCAKEGVKLLFVWEGDWLNKQELVKEAVSNTITGAQRRCDIELTSKLSIEWSNL